MSWKNKEETEKTCTVQQWRLSLYMFRTDFSSIIRSPDPWMLLVLV